MYGTWHPLSSGNPHEHSAPRFCVNVVLDGGRISLERLLMLVDLSLLCFFLLTPNFVCCSVGIPF
jgi:hypothetical protein